MAFIHIAGNTYELVVENRNGWNVEAFRSRYSEVLERYDYIVGDWGYNQLRLKGFFKDGHQKATKDTTFSYVPDYLNEYCNFGCAYFLLEKKQGSESVQPGEDDIYIEEAEYTRPIPVPAAKEKEAKDGREAKELKTKAAPNSAASDDSQGANKEAAARSKRSSQRNKQTESTYDANQEKPRSRNNNQRPRNNNQRQNFKQHIEQQEDITEFEPEIKKEVKPKRKEHFYRKGNRTNDKKGKAGKQPSEQISSGSSKP